MDIPWEDARLFLAVAETGSLSAAARRMRVAQPTVSRRVAELEALLGETLFVVLNGRGKVTRRGRKVGEVLPGDFFGELSALDGGPRSATVTAETPMRVLRLFRHTLRDLLRDEPGLTLKLLDGIVRRMREVQRHGADVRD